MRSLALALALLATPAQASDPLLAPTGTLRAAYIVANLAQATRNPTTGVVTGVIVDITNELARQAGVSAVITPTETAAGVLRAVQSGAADIGFVAPNPERMGVVLYSQTYMLVQQSALVRNDSPMHSVQDLDGDGMIIGANTDDSVSTWLKSHLQHAHVRESADYTLQQPATWLAVGAIQAFAGNRQRLRAANLPGLHLLPDNLYTVPQTIAVARDRPALLAKLNITIDEMRANAFLESTIKRSGVDGIEVAPQAR